MGYSSNEAVKARNSEQGEEEYWANKAAGISNGYDPMSTNPGKGRGKGGGRGGRAAEVSDGEESGSGSGSEAEQAPKAKSEPKAQKEEEPKKEKKPKEEKEDKDEGIAFKVRNVNDVKTNIDKDGTGELTRKQREELDKAAAKKRYEELHKQGKTDEAKADLKRLEEVKARREEAARKKIEDAAAAEAAEAQKKNPKAAMQAELKDIMGGQAAGQRGKKKGGGDKDDEKKEEKDKLINGTDESAVYAPYATKEKAAEAPQMRKPTDGTIQACRAVEEDFM